MRRILALLCLAVLLLSSCQDESEPATPEPSTPEQNMSFSESGTDGAIEASESAVIDPERLAALEDDLEELREILLIPGLSAAVVKDQELVWAKGFGFADLANKIPATPDTPYHLASVTKPIAATVIMQLVEEGLLDLEEPVSDFGVELESEGTINSRHLLTHTSSGVPGTEHHYDGNRYGYMGQIAQEITGESFRQLINERLLTPIGMSDTAPNLVLCPGEDERPVDTEREEEYLQVHTDMAKPYMVDTNYDVIDGDYQTIFSPAAGLISSVSDIAKFDIALDRDELISPETKALMFEPQISTYGEDDNLMYALGWYHQKFDDVDLLWHTGRWTPSISALYLKVPEENLTFIASGNTANLSTPFPLGYGDVMYSALAVAFYKNIVFPELYGSDMPKVDWGLDKEEVIKELEQVDDEHARLLLQRELLSRRMALMSAGRFAEGFDLLVANDHVFEPAEGLALYDSSAAMDPPEGPPIQLGEAEVERLTGDYELTEFPPSLNPGDVPSKISIHTLGDLLVACPDSEDEGLVLTPIAPDRMRVLGGSAAYMYVGVSYEDEKAATISVQLTDEITLTYTAADQE